MLKLRPEDDALAADTPPDFAQLASRIVFLDIEADKEDKQIFHLGAVWGSATFERKDRIDAAAFAALDAFAARGELVAGHNVLGHDLPILHAHSPHLRLLQKPTVDTLWLSALAFPKNPYHRLIKDHRLLSSSANDPVADAKLARQILQEEWSEFRDLGAKAPNVLALYQYFLRGAPDAKGFAAFFQSLGVTPLDEQRAAAAFEEVCSTDLACRSAVRELLAELQSGAIRELPALAFCVAWLRVSGSSSVLPPWVRRTFPSVVSLLRRLRDQPCADGCDYCRSTHHPLRQLDRFFRFPAFQPTPAAPDGSSLQEAIVRAGMRDTPLLAILPTGAGKSLCFQLPALARNLRRGVLTIVISPLQALMKDQVDGLANKTGSHMAAALYGALTPTERAAVLEGVRLGSVAILYVSPEQLRNRSFRKAIRSREIGCWVFDEAHCLSKWGHDFRTDYLYAARFIRELAEEQGIDAAPISCFTATAKREVRDEILQHFRTELRQELQRFEGGVERHNLTFEVHAVPEAEKLERIAALLAERLPDSGHGSAVVFAATRKGSERIADSLSRQGWTAAAYHAGLDPPVRREIQERFLSGDLRVICATNAFGMGIDKPDVRLVIHADIPGSLENYLQEAGRAGRDREPSSCVLLFAEDDIEMQFQLGAFSELRRSDIEQIYRTLRKAKRRKGEIVITPGELLRDDATELSFDANDASASTKVKTAVAWLERAGFLERNDNETAVFQGRPRVRNLEEARARMSARGIPESERPRWEALLTALMTAAPDEALSADDLAKLPELRMDAPRSRSSSSELSVSEQVLRLLEQMAKAGLLESGLLCTAFVRHGVARDSKSMLEQVSSLDAALLRLMREEAADADDKSWQHLSLRRLNQRLRDDGHTSSTESLRNLLRSLEQDSRGLAAHRRSLDLIYVAQEQYRVRLHQSWAELEAVAARRRGLASVALQAILARIPKGAAPSAELLVPFALADAMRAIESDLELGGQTRDALAAGERALLFLHEQKVISLQQGLAVFRQAMTIRLRPEAKGRRYTTADYAPLRHYYDERSFQVHVMDEYARLGAEDMKRAHALVAAYFFEDKLTFVKRFFAGREDVIARATSEASYRAIVESLGSRAQSAIVLAPRSSNLLVLAGPGSGKTKTVVHRCAYLVRVERVPARGILVVCFSRAAALLVRRRLDELIGRDADAITIQTYHGVALRLTGRSLAARAEGTEDGSVPFDDFIDDAIRLLQGHEELPGLAPDEVRDRLLAGYTHILVDEYQDIDARQYELLSALAGRTVPEGEHKISILAVGDDDQNIYSWRGSSVQFLRRFQEDYQAEPHYLVENYRSTRHIIAAANQVIRANPDRMKADQDIRVNAARKRQAPGGVWATRDRLTQGRVQVLEVDDELQQAQAVVAEIERLRGLDPSAAWESFAVLARTHRELGFIRTVCEHRSVPVQWTLPKEKVPPLYRIREIYAFLEALQGRRTEHLDARTLIGLVAAQQTRPENPWLGLVRRLVGAWRDEAGDGPRSVDDFLEFAYETLVETGREQSINTGVFLGTLYAAKGLEFDHVLLPDGSTGSLSHKESVEDSRRLFYVGMTRARQTLCLFDRRDSPGSFGRGMRGDFLLRRRPEGLSPVPDRARGLQYDLIGMKDLFVSFAGGKPPQDAIHRHLAALQPGDPLRLVRQGDFIELQDSGDVSVAALSQEGRTAWRERLGRIDRVRVIAMAQRSAKSEKEEFRSRLRCERWELPIAEVVYRATPT